MSDDKESIAARRQQIQVARRRAKVLEMYNKCATQQEMAEALGVSQPTIFRDLRVLARQARRKVDAVRTNASLEAARLISGADSAIKRAWEIVDSKDLTNKERMAAISLLLKCYDAKKEFLPSALGAQEYEEQQKEMFNAAERVLEAEMERRGLMDDEDESGGSPAVDNGAVAGPQDYSSLVGALEGSGGG